MKNSLELKQELLTKCHQFCEIHFDTITQNIEELQIALTTETKSSAGDKHETGRAMLQLEREKLGNQLAEISKVKEALSKINITNNLSKIGLGSIVYTTQSNYFIAISSGELKVNNETFFAISPGTPIGKLLLGKQVGDEERFRQNQFTITRVI